MFDIADQGRVEQPFRFHPKIFGGFFALALGVADQGVYQLQHVFFRVQIPKRVVFHALGKIDGVQHFHAVAAADKELAHFTDQAALGIGQVYDAYGNGQRHLLCFSSQLVPLCQNLLEIGS